MHSMPFLEGGQVHGQDVDAVEQILPELVEVDLPGEILVGGGNDPDIDVNGLVAADPFKGFLFQDAEQFGLNFHADFADLIEKDGAAVGLLEAADPLFVRTGERAFFVAEQLGSPGAIPGYWRS